jgi:hypothetical protein
MIDWNTYREQVIAGVGRFAELRAETVRGYRAIGGAGLRARHRLAGVCCA